MSDNNFNDWTLYKNYDEEYEEKICPLYNTTVIFSIKSYKQSETTLSFTDSSSSEKVYRYTVKGSVDYAKKIVENTVKSFDNTPVDCGDIDLCLRKAFSLRKTNTP